MDFDLDGGQLLAIALALGIAALTWFTTVGGFSVFITGEKFNPGWFVQIIAPLIAGVAAYFWFSYKLQ